MPDPIRALRYPLEIDPGGRRLRIETDYEDYVSQLIRQVLLTNPGERVNRPEFGAGVRRLLFTPLGIAAGSLARTMIYKALNDSLSALIRVDEVEARANAERLDVTITYTVLARMEQRFLNVEVTI